MLLQILFEVLAELGLHAIKEPFRRPAPKYVWLAAIGYAIFGATAGGVSLILFRALFIDNAGLRVVNLFITPVVAGLVMALFGAWRRRRGEDVIRLDRFSYGFLFAIAMAGIRFVYGK